MTGVRVATIGAGNWGRNHVRNLAMLPEAELVAVCDTSEQRRRATQRQYPAVHVTEDYAEALDLAEAVVIATPATSHATLAIQAIERGLPVLVEKPLALSVREAECVAELSESRGVPVVTGHLLLFHSAIERLAQLIGSGDLGDLYYLYSQRVNLGQVRPDENALWSFGPHDVAVALHLLGSAPVRVAAQGRSYLQPGIEDVVFMNMDFASGLMAHVQMSWLDPHKERRLTVVGSEKMVVFDDMQSREKLKIYDKGVDRPPDYSSYGESLSVREGDIAIPRVPNVEPLAAELRHFLAVVRGREQSRTPASDGVAVVRVLEAASQSLVTGGIAVDLSVP
ncbi:MAG: Gfo/Idh/MocA family oxidoreductase [Gemmatimonadota bacterium]|nr:MAG: Gfo/Idh/MocA family oxidoreductase [Gemmatimonadota bacterium]